MSKEFYEEEINKYKKFFDNPKNYKNNWYVYDWALGQTKKGDYVLDVACGIGVLCKMLKEAGRNPSGLDLTELGIKTCKENISGVPFVCGPANKLPFQDKMFDCVISTQFIEHLKHPEVEIKEMIRVLSPGGKLIITTPINYNLEDKDGKDVGHIQHFRFYDIMDLFDKFGDDYKVYWLSKYIQFDDITGEPKPKSVFGVVFVNGRKEK